MDWLKNFCIMFVVLGLIASSHPAQAEETAVLPILQLVQPSGLLRAGDQIAVELRADSKGELINAMEALVHYPADMLRVVSIGREQSVLTLWTEEPHADEVTGTVGLSGGRPGGFFANDAAVATVYFEALRAGTALLRVDTDHTVFYLHDGLGTGRTVAPSTAEFVIADPLVPSVVLKSTTHATPQTWSQSGSVAVQWQPKPGAGYSYHFGTSIRELPDDRADNPIGEVRYGQLADGIYYFTIKERSADGTWSAVTQRRFLIDSTPPAPFTITRLDPASVGDAQLLAWSTTDATSGVHEFRLHVNGADRGAVTSPLPFQSSWTDKTVVIVAYDTAGNTSVSTFQSAKTPVRRRTQPLLFTGIAIIMLGLFSGLMVFFRERRRR